MKAIHIRIAQLAVSGLNAEQIAEAVDRTPQMVRYTLNSVLVQEKIGDMLGALDENALNVAKTLQEYAPLALRELITQLIDENSDKATKRDLAKDLLDRAHFGKNSSVQVNVGLSKDDLADIKAAAKKMPSVSLEEGDGFEVLEEDADE